MGVKKGKRGKNQKNNLAKTVEVMSIKFINEGWKF